MRARLARFTASARGHRTDVADVVGAGLVAVGIGAYSLPAGLIAAGVAVLAGSWVAAARGDA